MADLSEEETLLILLKPQVECLRISEYEDEFITMQTVREQQKSNSLSFRKSWMHWINSLKIEEESILERKARSTALREQGNKLYQAAPKKNALTASRLYTQAMLAAPPLDECLALAHANRAMTLLEFGYYEQAYDDCECALEHGYKEQLHHKLWVRQAFCAQQLGDAERLKQQLDKLNTLTLNDKFGAQVEELNHSLKEMQCKDSDQTTCQEQRSVDDHRQSQQILNDENRGRFMVATQFIDENEIIFEENASSFVPVPHLLVCQQCASTQFIPFPCYHCHGKVAYCSLKCRRMHASTHSFECAAYQCDLFKHVGIGHLALRIVLDNVAKWSSMVRSGKSAEWIWKRMLKGESVGSYGESLQMITHLGKMSMPDIIWFALLSQILVLYLSKFTSFFKALIDVNTKDTDVELITGSLILRHIGQLISNAHTVSTICRSSSTDTVDLLDFDLMSDDLWASPGHLLCGQLHQFRNVSDVFTVNFPYLSLCNHSCSPSFIPKFSGHRVTTFAVRPINAGEEIFNCYTNDYCKSTYFTRWSRLIKSYHFECKCLYCRKPNPDEEYNKFHQYRCSQTSCRKVFTLLAKEDDLNWWSHPDEFNHSNIFRCSICHTPQNWMQRHDYFMNKLDFVRIEKNRLQLYTYFDKLNEWLVDYHQLKLIYAHRIVSSCYAANLDGIHLSPKEFSTLTRILKFLLRGLSLQNRSNSIEYVTAMTYFWDFIALGKYKPTNDEISETLHAITILSDDFQRLFLNYYKDYIVNKVNG